MMGSTKIKKKSNSYSKRMNWANKDNTQLMQILLS